MPDDRRAERERRYDESIAEWHLQNDEPSTEHLDPAARAECGLCDGDGYRPTGVVCDHVDRAAIAKAGSARCREMLKKGSTSA